MCQGAFQFYGKVQKTMRMCGFIQVQYSAEGFNPIIHYNRFRTKSKQHQGAAALEDVMEN